FRAPLQRHILTDMFSDKNRPFYRSSLVYPLGKIPESAFASFIAERFAATGKDLSCRCGRLHLSISERLLLVCPGAGDDRMEPDAARTFVY
ncbi:MAG: hypothetical protein AB6733_18480, partial [Clostridiaceae bacterium]